MNNKLIGIGATLFAFCVFLANPLEVNAKSDQILSDEIIGYCDEIGEHYGICSELLQAMIEKESTGNPDAVNGGCIGLMQISERWHMDRMNRLGVDDLFDPYSNILVGADYISELAEKHGDVALVLDIYNGNSKAFCNNDNGIISSYAKWILERSEELEREHGK